MFLSEPKVANYFKIKNRIKLSLPGLYFVTVTIICEQSDLDSRQGRR